MTDHQPDPGTDPAEAYATEYRRLWDATVATLTAAVQLDHPQHGPVDFSDFLASALGAVAANVGSGYRITLAGPAHGSPTPSASSSPAPWATTPTRWFWRHGAPCR